MILKTLGTYFNKKPPGMGVFQQKREETMPTDACQYFYECEKCKQVLKPKQGDCCVYCSYGSVACPPIQQDKKCC